MFSGEHDSNERDLILSCLPMFGVPPHRNWRRVRRRSLVPLQKFTSPSSSPALWKAHSTMSGCAYSVLYDVQAVADITFASPVPQPRPSVPPVPA